MEVNFQTSFVKRVALCAALIVCFLAAQSALAAVWYVDINASPNGDGTEWSTAFNDLHDALDNPSLLPGDHIWVAAGTYVPSQQSGIVNGDAFDLPEEVRLYGGFAGTESSLSDRQVVNDQFVNETILTNPNGYVLAAEDIGDGVDDVTGTRSIVNGFTIREAGNAVVLINAAPVFIRCRFIENDARAVFAQGPFAGRAPEFINCAFIGNEAVYGAGVTVFDMVEAETVFTNCLFVDNVATGLHAGGAIRSHNSNGRIVNCRFFRNDAEQSAFGGGGVSLEGTDSPGFTWHINNSIFWANVADCSGGEDAQVVIRPGWDMVTLHVNSTLIEGLTGNLGGQGNIDDDPEFVSETTPDLRLQAGSPAIDTGRNNVVPPDRYNVADNPTFDPNDPTPELDLLKRIINGVVDRGPYEYVPEGDLAGTGSVGWEDMDVLLANYNCEGECLGDFNLDEKVDDEDVVTLLELIEGE